MGYNHPARNPDALHTGYDHPARIPDTLRTGHNNQRTDPRLPFAQSGAQRDNAPPPPPPPPPPIAYAGCATPAPRLTHPCLLPHTPLCVYAVGAGGAGGGAHKGGTRNEGRCNPSGERLGLHRQRRVLACAQRLEDTRARRDGAGRGATQKKAARERRGVRTRVVLPRVRAKAGGCASGA
ncbi:hypothetical protein BJY52DRAFT_1231683 [Lactarius psammicola]|nr:hypothetical protein BJY52DRAFT_1231683 [Lactarius psammicola]